MLEEYKYFSFDGISNSLKAENYFFKYNDIEVWVVKTRPNMYIYRNN